MVLATLGGCHLLDGLVVVSVVAHKEDLRCSGVEIVRGIVLTPREPQRANLVERVIELPSLGSWGSYSAQRVGLVWCQLAAEPPSEWSTQRGLACLQAREPRDKIIVSSLSSCWFAIPLHKHAITFIYIVIV